MSSFLDILHWQWGFEVPVSKVLPLLFRWKETEYLLYSSAFLPNLPRILLSLLTRRIASLKGFLLSWVKIKFYYKVAFYFLIEKINAEFCHPWIFLGIFLFSFFCTSEFLVCLLPGFLYSCIYLFVSAAFMEAQTYRCFIDTVLFLDYITMFFGLSILKFLF